MSFSKPDAPVLTADDIAELRRDTPGCTNRIHFNNAGTGLALGPSLEAVKAYLDLEAGIGGYEAHAAHLSEHLAFYSNVARLLNAQPSEIAFIENATRAWDMAFYGIDFRPGDRIITGRAEYVSNFVALLQMQRLKGIEIDLIDDDAHGQIDLKALAAAITPRTRLIALTHIPTFGGLINPAEEVGAIATRHNLLYLLDACQSAGHVPLDVKAIGCHMLSGTGRKYLRGPRGTGFLYVSETVLDQLEPPFVDLEATNWTGPSSYDLKPGARRFENWERFFAGQIGLAVAVGYALDVGMERLSARIVQLGADLREGLAGLPGVSVHDKGLRKGGIVTFLVEGEDPRSTQARLAQHGINVSVSQATSSQIDLPARGLSALVRASVHAFNTQDEVVRVLDAVAMRNG